jgi:vacuolar-type H+-ATPase subunit E/Vma4
MQTLGSPASVVAAIREDGEAEVERIRETAAAELASIATEAASMNVAIGDREERLTAARRANEERVARQEWEGRRAVMQQRETWIERVVAKAQEGWGPSPAAALDALVREARSRLPEGDCEVIASPRGGCIVRIGDLSFDNSFEARSRRLEPEWRNALSGMYKP